MWSKIDHLFDRALDQPPEERSHWLDEACGGDLALKAEVQRLLEFCEAEDDRLRPNGALTGPIWEEVVQDLDPGADVSTFQPGDKIGGYEIVGLAGSGGMGQVYVAQDLRLGRKVALKVLPPGMDSKEHRKRFEREAKAVAALNHPNIVHIYSVEEEDGVHFITMELVQGQTLAELIPDEGMSLSRFFDVSIHLVDALTTAHERGVIHRDLKPTNIMVSEEGRVKILDFGLAKLEPERFSQRKGPSTHSATMQGRIVGTVSHMSPEQAEGKDIDHRTDIFSLGVILFEMSTGQVPFRGDSTAAVLSAIIKDTPPPVSTLNPRLPSELSRIIKKCLAKDRQKRYQTSRDVRIDLEELKYELDSRKLFQSALPRPSSRRLAFASVGAAAVLGLIGLAVVAGRFGGRDTAPSGGTFTQLTSEQGQEMFPSLSPDGNFLVYAGRVADDWDIFLLRVGGRRSINLTADSSVDDTQPTFSPDGEHIAFRSARGGGGIFVMGATGEFVRRVTSFGWNPSWSPDSRRIVFATEAISRTPADRPTTSQLWIADVDNGETRLLLEGDGVQPAWSPRGLRIAYWGLDNTGQRDLWTLPADGGEPRAVTRDAAVDWNPVWSPDGRFLYFSSDRGGSMNVWRVPLDEETGAVRGEPEPVTTPSPFATHLSFSHDGNLLAYTSTFISFLMQSAEWDPRTASLASPVELTAGDVRDVASPDPSPDGEWVAFSRVGIQEDIVLVRPDGSDRHPVTDDPYRDRHPRWSPDGKRIAFYSNRSGSYEIWTVNPDGSGLEQLTDTPERNLRYPIWSPDGTRMAFSNPGTSGTLFDPRTPWKDQTPYAVPRFSEGGDEFVPMDWSPDGKWLVGYIQTPSGIRSGIGVFSLENESYEKLTDFGLNPRWMKDSRRILFQAQSELRSREQHNYQQDYTLYVVDRETKKFDEVLAVPGASAETPALSGDDHTLFYVLTRIEADIWTLRLDGKP